MILREARGKTVEHLYEVLLEKLGTSERDLLAAASLFRFPISLVDLKAVYKAIFGRDDFNTQLAKLRRHILIKHESDTNNRVHEAVKAMALEHAGFDLVQAQLTFAHALIAEMSDEYGSRLEAVIAFSEAGAHAEAAEHIVPLVEWSLPEFPEAAEAILSRAEMDEVPSEQQIWLHNLYGKLAGDKRDYQEAERNYSAMLSLAEDLHDKAAASTALQNLGSTHVEQDDTEAARKDFLQALALKEELGDVEGQAEIYNNLGLLHSQLEEFPEATEMLEKALQLREDISSPEYERIAVYGNLGILNARQKNWTEAERYTRLAYRSALKSGSDIEKARTKFNWANIKSEQGHDEIALRRYKEVLDKGLSRHSRMLEELARPALAKLYFRTGETDLAIENFRGLLALRERFGDYSGMIPVYLDLVGCSFTNGDEADALDYYGKVADLFEHTNSDHALTIFIQNMGVLANRVDKELSLSILKKVRKKLRDDHPPLLHGQIYRTLGDIFSSLPNGGRVSTAYYLRAEKFFADALDFEGQVRTLIDIGLNYENAGRRAKAISILDRAVTIGKDREINELLPVAYFNRGTNYGHEDLNEEAEQDYQEALRIAAQNEDEDEEENAEILERIKHNLGETLRRLGSVDVAIPLLKSAIDLSKGRGNIEDQILGLSNLALAYRDIDPEEETRCLDRALTLAQDNFLKREEAEVLIRLGNLAVTDEEPERAKEYFERAMKASTAAEDSEMEEKSMASLVRPHLELGTAKEIEVEFLRILERANDLGHYENLFVLLFAATEINFSEKEFDEAAKTLFQAFQVAISLDTYHLDDFDTVPELFALKHYEDFLLRLFGLIAKAVDEGRSDEAETLFQRFSEYLESDLEWSNLARRITGPGLAMISDYFREGGAGDFFAFIGEKEFTSDSSASDEGEDDE